MANQINPRYKIRELLPLRLRRVFDRLTNGLWFDRTNPASYQTLLRLALFLCEIEDRAGPATIKAAMRRTERILEKDT